MQSAEAQEAAQEASQALFARAAWNMVAHHWRHPDPDALAVEEAAVVAVGDVPHVLPEPLAEAASGAAAAEAAAAAGVVTAV